MPGFTGSNRKQLLPSNWETQIRPRILTRDLHQCQWVRQDTGKRCLAPQSHDVDHIIRPADGGTDDDNNLQTLCRYHHNRKTGYEGGKASGAARRTKRANKTKPLHPGLMVTKPDDNPMPF